MNNSQDEAALRLRLMQAARSGADGYIREYTDSLSLIGPIAAASEDRAVRPLVVANSADAVNAIKVSLLYNNVSTLTLGFSQKAHITILSPKNAPGGQGFKVITPADRDDIFEAAKRGEVSCGVMLPTSDDDNRFYSDIAPLVGQGRVIISPVRMLLYPGSGHTPEGQRTWDTHVTDPLAPLDVWSSQDLPPPQGQIVKTVTDRALAMHDSTAGIDHKHELVLPYIDSISLTEYAKILEDESDHLSLLRAELSEYLKQLSQGEKSIEEFRRDVVQPKIDRIERDFRRITAASNIRVGGMVVGSALMCAATVATSGVAAAIAAAAGTAGLIGGAKELGDRYEKVSALRNEPLHLLWRLKQRGQIQR